MNAEEQKLADLIREHPNLYDQSRQDYKDNLKTHLSWLAIADSMEKPEDELKHKWKNLRDKFCKAMKRMAMRNVTQPVEDENATERPVPTLYQQLAWLHDFVKHRKDTRLAEADEGGDLEKEPGKEKMHLRLPVVSTSFSLVESCPNNHQEMEGFLKRRRRTTAGAEMSSADELTALRDEDELFLFSLLPSLKRLTIKKRMEVRMKFQQVLYAAEFED